MISLSKGYFFLILNCLKNTNFNVGAPVEAPKNEEFLQKPIKALAATEEDFAEGIGPAQSLLNRIQYVTDQFDNGDNQRTKGHGAQVIPQESFVAQRYWKSESTLIPTSVSQN